METEPLKSLLNPTNAAIEKLTIIQNARKIEYLTDAEIAEVMRKFPADNEALVKAFRAAKSAGAGEEFIDTFGDTIYIKHSDWRYEQEYRIAIDNGNRGVMWPGKVTAIYLGTNASPQYCRITCS